MQISWCYVLYTSATYAKLQLDTAHSYILLILNINSFRETAFQTWVRIIGRHGLITVLFDRDNEQPLQEFSCVFFLQTLEAYEKKKKIALFPWWHFSDILMCSVSGEVGRNLVYMFK